MVPEKKYPSSSNFLIFNFCYFWMWIFFSVQKIVQNIATWIIGFWELIIIGFIIVYKFNIAKLSYTDIMFKKRLVSNTHYLYR